MSEFTDALISEANAWVGEREVTQNRSPRIDILHEFCNRDPAFCDPYCAQFCSYMLHLASLKTGIKCPLLKSSSAMEFMRKNISFEVKSPQPGDLFIIDHGGGKGHMGIVESISPLNPDILQTIEANTNPTGGRDGDGIYARSRHIKEIICFIRAAV